MFNLLCTVICNKKNKRNVKKTLNYIRNQKDLTQSGLCNYITKIMDKISPHLIYK